MGFDYLSVSVWKVLIFLQVSIVTLILFDLRNLVRMCHSFGIRAKLNLVAYIDRDIYIYIYVYYDLKILEVYNFENLLYLMQGQATT